jgi:hypothetical protein
MFFISVDVFIKNTTFMNSYNEGISKDSNKIVTNET